MAHQKEAEASFATRFTQDGFAVISELADEDTLHELRAVYDGMLDGSVPCIDGNRNLGGITRQIMYPCRHHEIFERNAALDRARAVASRLMRIDEPEFVFSMLIYKPAGHPHSTPWHQDMAYAGKPTTATGTHLPNDTIVQFWLALDDVDEDMGCMEFVRRPDDDRLLPHFVASGDPDDDGRLLAIVDPAQRIDIGGAVKCPLKAGSATVHGYTTPHYTGPNRSTRGRRAYIFSFANKRKLDEALADLGRTA
jgi:ectoine hydroxylase-related dioxygenase (phytanoyl-CoA dioxygenase family)